MTTNSVSKEQIRPVAPHALAQSVDELQTFLNDKDGIVSNITNEVSFGESIALVLQELSRLQSLRTSSGGVTSGEVVTHLKALMLPPSKGDSSQQRRDFNDGVRAAIAALSSLHAQPSGNPGELPTADRVYTDIDDPCLTGLASMMQQPFEGNDGRVQIIEQSDTMEGGYALTLELDGKDTVVLVNFARPQGTGSREAVAWSDEASAPKDSTLIRLLVEPDGEAHTSFEDSEKPYETIGFNQLSDTGDDEWHFAGWDWSHDCITQGYGKVIGWRPFLSDTLVPLSQLQAMERVAASHFLNKTTVERELKTAEASLAAAEKRAATLEHPFRNADDSDWTHLFAVLPDTGRGKFWQSVLRSARAALAGSNRE